VEEILKVMTEPLPIKLSPLAPELTKFFQKEKEPSATESPTKPKKRRIIQVADVIHQKPPPISASKILFLKALSLLKPQPPEPKPPELKPPEQPPKLKPPEPKPRPPKILI
jgi:hypothetical protein